MKKQPFKVVLVATVPQTFETILKGIPRWLDDYYSVAIVTSPEVSDCRLASIEGVEVYHIEMERGISPFKDFVSVFNMTKLFWKLRPSLVHSYTPKAGLVAMLSSWLCSVNVRVHTFTGLLFPTEVGFRRRLLMLTDRLTCAFATNVVPEGRGVARDLVENRITRKPLRLIANGNVAGVDVNYYSPNRSEINSKKKDVDFVFCFVGRLTKDKGISELLYAFQKTSGNVKLLIAGSIDKRVPLDDAQYERLVSNPKISHLGFVEDVRDVIQQSDVVVLPSYREGFPNILLQAGALGKPVIATDVNGSNEIVVDGVNGWLVAPRDREALAQVMAEVRNIDKSQLDSMGRIARERVLEKFEQSFYRTKLLEFYEELLVKTKS